MIRIRFLSIESMPYPLDTVLRSSVIILFWWLLGIPFPLILIGLIGPWPRNDIGQTEDYSCYSWGLFEQKAWDKITFRLEQCCQLRLNTKIRSQTSQSWLFWLVLDEVDFSVGIDHTWPSINLPSVSLIKLMFLNNWPLYMFWITSFIFMFQNRESSILCPGSFPPDGKHVKTGGSSASLRGKRGSGGNQRKPKFEAVETLKLPVSRSDLIFNNFSCCTQRLLETKRCRPFESYQQTKTEMWKMLKIKTVKVYFQTTFNFR